MENIFGNAKHLGFGLMRLPLLNPEVASSIDIEQMKKMVDIFLERGFTYFDTALMYCGSKSESAIKEALTSRYPREKYTLTTKLHCGFVETQEDCERVFKEQLERTGVEYFDYYLIHDINTDSFVKYNKLNIFDFVQKKKAEGLAKHVGFSFHDGPELLDRVLTEHPELEFVQLQVNYLDFDSPAIRSRENLEVAARHDKPVIIMEPVKGGTLINLPEEVLASFRAFDEKASPAAWAIRFAASQKNVCMVLSGMSNIEQMEDNTSFMQDFKPLSEVEKGIVAKAAGILTNTTVIPCTGCSYCTEGCPMSIPIPKYFSLYNAEERENPDGKKDWTPQQEYYEVLSGQFGRASSCVGCGQCEGICPQHLKITELLMKVSDRFE